jgi:hypothetical protein
MEDFIAPSFDSGSSVDTSNDSPIDTESSQSESPDVDVNPFKGTKHKIKANGKELELDYEEVLKRAEKAEGADLKFQEAAQVKRQMKELESKLGKLSAADQDNFLEMIDIIGWEKAQKFANTLVKKQVEWDELSEQQQAQILRDQEAEEAKAELASIRKREQDATAERAKSIALDLVDKDVGEALAYAKEQGLPVGPKFAEQVVDELLAYLEYCEAEDEAGRKITVPPPTAVDVAKKILGQKTQNTQSFLKKLDAKSLRSMLSPEQLSELRQMQIDELHSPIPRNASKRQANDESINPFDQKSNEKPRSSKGWFDAMDKKFGVKK